MKAKLFRRGLGLACLLGALGLLIAGELGGTARLSLAGTVLYWCACLVLALGAFATALWDARIIRRQAQAEQRELFRRTFAGLDLKDAGLDENETGRGQQPKPRADGPKS
jgi:hypothetical protein